MSKILIRSKIFLVLFMLFVMVGIYTFLSLPQREIPEISINVGTVTTVYPGATVEDVERDITNPIEVRLASISGLEEITSSSSAGFSSIVLTIEEGVEKNQILSDVRQAVSEVAVTFPSNAQTPTVNAVSEGTPIASYHLISDEQTNLQALHKEMIRWKEEIEAISGVERVIIKGLAEEEITISFDSRLLAEHQINLSSVLNAIENEYAPIPLGKVEKAGTITQLKVGHFRDFKDLEDIMVGLATDALPLYLKDVATITIEPSKQTDIITFEKKPSISFTAFVKPQEDIPTVNERVNNRISELSIHLPDTVELVPYYSQASIVTEIFKGLFISFGFAVAAVIITTTLGLTLSGAFTVALAVPISILIGIIPLPFAGVDLNQISIIGAIIALGILVDDSIVVNENIQRHYKMGKNALNGAVDGVKEVWVSIITSTLAIVFTFLPLVFLSGANGAFIRALPTVLITTILASTVIALLFVPMLRYICRKNSNKSISNAPGILGKPLDWLANIYADKLLKSASKRPFTVASVGLLVTTAIFALVLWTPFEFFPSADREEVTIDVTLPIGTKLEETYQTLEEMANFLSVDEGVYETSIFAGTGLPNLFNSSLDMSGDYTGQIVVRVDRVNQNAQGLINAWTKPLREQFPEAVIFLETIEQGPPSGAPVTVTITGPEIGELINIRNTLQEHIENFGADLVLDNIGEPEPALIFQPKREKLEEYNISVNQISEQIRLATDGIPYLSFYDGVTKRDTTIFIDRLEPGQELNISEMEFAIPNEQGPPTMIALDELVTVLETEELQRIPHINRERAIILRAFPGTVENFKSKVEEIVALERKNLEDVNYSITMGGENEAQDSFFAEIIILFLIVILLVYLLIAFQFNSITIPFLVLIAVYLAIAGAILGLFVTQTPISFLAVMGMVSLTGIVVRNSVVLIEFIEQRQRSGWSITEAVIESGRTRLRPILLTAITSIVALIPIAVAGDALFTPLAVTIISGILFSTLLTLIIVPMLYLVLARFRKKQIMGKVN